MAKRYNSGSYEGMDSRRAQEAMDGSMMPNDRTSFANMPQNVISRDYPPCSYGLTEVLNDSITGVDGQINKDIGKLRAHLKPKKV